MSSSDQQQADVSVLRWLHLTDLHTGNKNESQQTALTSLVAAIETYSNKKPYDLVFLTGDLAYSGLKEEYLALENYLINPLKSSSLFSNATFFAVPGNHDINCEIGCPLSWSTIGKSRQESFFYLDELGTRIRSGRAEAFVEYQNFVHRTGIVSVDPTLKPAMAHLIDNKQRKFVILSVVTAFFSDKEVSDQKKTPAPVHPIRTILQDFPEEITPIILGHHPMSWFLQDTERHLHSFLVERNALYLHGHEHLVKTKFGGRRGLLSMGFGAGYQAPFDSPATSYYRNSFAICELSDSLHVSIVSWDSENGKWRPDVNLPGDFIERSTRLADGYCLPLPSSLIIDQAGKGYASIATGIRTETYIENCIWLTDSTPKRWSDLLVNIGEFQNITEIYALPTQTLPAGHCLFRVKDQRGQYLIRAVSGLGDVLNYEQIEAINTELDKQDYDGSLVVTLGELASDAKTLATQLESRKAISVLERTDIVRRIVGNLPSFLSKAITQLEPTLVSGSLVITDKGFALLIQDRTKNAWFYVLGEDGKVVAESDNLVFKLRQENFTLRQMSYIPQGEPVRISQDNKHENNPFSREEYLQKSHAYFDDVKYAPLAALGFKFRNASLSEIYVNASAGVSGGTKSSQTLTQAVSELVESLNLPQVQRDQLESQLRSRYGADRTAEVGAARHLYQRYNNIVVLGEPGSGKTCFVKHEILAYCLPPQEEGSWYSYHLPIYVSLAEAARLLDDKVDLLDICEIVTSRRGIALSREVIEIALTEGKCAFFFDGLDEVGYLDKRIALVSEINNIVKSFASRGNRFVLASRPAAIQPVDIPEAFTYLELKGLTEQEIRTLAGRVLRVRLGDEEESELTSEEKELVDRLIEDTQARLGIARLARNPLLLTLLVLIYANTGALSARRHLIYTQAIKTLVGVRGKQTREQQISEADLRTRLGALALAIFKRIIAEIPRRSEVVKTLGPLLSNDNSQIDKSSIVNAFIQEIAEATGLLSIHKGDDETSEDLITFMHYSFLEYYAAAGLLACDYANILPSLSGNPRWKDVTTLLFGILSEQGDVTPLLKEVLVDRTPSDGISKYKLLLAFECASECDVPPEASQELLATALFETISKGAARYSADLREKLAVRLEYFLLGARARIENALIRGLSSPDAMSIAATADLIARLGESVKLSPELITAFANCLAQENPVTRAAVMFAIERRPELRTEKVEKIIKESLKGSVIEKHAALKIISSIPSYHLAAEDNVRKLLDDPNELISSAAARCMLANALQDGRWQEEDIAQEKILAKLYQSNAEDMLSIQGITLDRKVIQVMISNGTSNEVELAIRFTPLIRDDNQFVYQTLMGSLRTTKDIRHKVAILDSIRMSPGAMDLITIADTDLICDVIKANEKNVRIATIRLLGELPDDEQVVQTLKDHLSDLAIESLKEEEITESAKALARHVHRNQRLRAEVINMLFHHMPKKAGDGFGDDVKQHHLLGLMLVCESIGGETNQVAAKQLLSLAEDYRTPINIRKQSMKVFGRIAEPLPENVDVFLRHLKKNDLRLNESVYSACSFFVSQCRKRVDYVRRVYNRLSELRDQLCQVWTREIALSSESIDARSLLDIRTSIVEIESLMGAYEEFSERAKITSIQ